MKYLIVTLLFAAQSSFAASRVRILPMDLGMSANVTERDIYGNMDSDPMDLYQFMNVDEQDSSMGKGKVIQTPQKDFILVCAKEKRACSIVLNKSPRTLISGTKKTARFNLYGAEAAQITYQFKLNDRGEAEFMATDKAWHLWGNANEFVFEAKATFP